MAARRSPLHADPVPPEPPDGAEPLPGAFDQTDKFVRMAAAAEGIDLGS